VDIVSLLPPEIKQKRLEGRRQAVLIRILIAFFIIVLVVYAYLLVSSILTRNSIESIRSERESVEMQINSLKPYADLFAEMTAAEQRLEQAMGANPQWSVFLQDIGLALPPGIWLSEMSITYAENGGSLNIRGWGFSNENIAEMLERVQALETVNDVRIQVASETTFEGQDAVQFTVDAVIVGNQASVETETEAEVEEEEEES
jgi:Tfp pilus assembly protein PilN